MFTSIKSGKELTQSEVNFISLHREKAFGSDDLIQPSSKNKDWNNLFILIKNDENKVLAFCKLHLLDLHFSNQKQEVLCFSTVVSTNKGKGYGKQIMNEIKKYADKTGKTVIGFCETKLLPFYRKCDYEILSNEDNHFVYMDEAGEVIPRIIPGEVIFTRGRDETMEKILASKDKTVKISRYHYQ